MLSDAAANHRRNMRRAHATWATLTIAAVATLIAIAASTEQPEGVCSGIGWGCQLSGTALAKLVALIVIPIAFVVLLIGHWVISAIGGTSRHRPPSTSAARPAGSPPPPRS